MQQVCQEEEKMDYKKAGVDIEAGYKSVELMKKHVAATMRPEVLTGIGGFSGAFSMESFKIWKSLRWFRVRTAWEPS